MVSHSYSVFNVRSNGAEILLPIIGVTATKPHVYFYFPTANPPTTLSLSPPSFSSPAPLLRHPSSSLFLRLVSLPPPVIVAVPPASHRTTQDTIAASSSQTPRLTLSLFAATAAFSPSPQPEGDKEDRWRHVGDLRVLSTARVMRRATYSTVPPSTSPHHAASNSGRVRHCRLRPSPSAHC